jgi:pantothenate kinase type III
MVKDIDEIEDLVNEINSRDFDTKDYQNMKIEELSMEIHEIIDAQYKRFQRIDEFEIKGTHPDLIKYAKMICRNSTERKISRIQKIYLDKIDTEYRNSK